MVWKLECDCEERVGIEINSFKLFKSIESFFQSQVSKGIFEDVSDYSKIWHEHGGSQKELYITTTKQYKCIACGCLWELQYPEFPAVGLVRKFPDGICKREVQ